MSTSAASGMSRVWMARISARPLRSGMRDLDFPVEAARAAQRGVEVVGDVGGADDDDLAAGLEAVHQCEQLGDDALLDLAFDVGAIGGDRVDLVEEDDAGALRLGFGEDGSQMGLAVPVELVDDLGAADGDEVRLGLIGDGPGQHGLAASGGAVEQHAARRVDAEPLEDLGVAHGQLNHLADPGHCLAKTADVLIRHLGRAGATGGHAARGLDLDAGRLGDHHEADRIGRGDAVVLSPGAEHTDAHALACPDCETGDERPDVTAVAGVRRECRADRRQRDRLGVRHLGEFHRDPVIEAGAGVLAGDAVHLDLPLPAFSGDQGHDL